MKPANRTPRHPLGLRLGAGASIAALAIACIAPAASAAPARVAEAGAFGAAGYADIVDAYNGSQGSIYGSPQGAPYGDDGYSGATTGSATADPGTRTDAAGVLLVETETAAGEAAGTGMVLTASGLALTNYHVVEDSTEVRVTVADTGATYTATVVGKDATKDVAVLQLRDASGLDTVTVNDDGTELGEAVAAIGNGEGQGYLTAVAGVLEATNESITTQASDGSGESLSGLLVTDADVVPGYSGGPLVDADGEVVGISTAASTGSEINGYAIPIDTALAIANRIVSGDESGTVDIGPDAAIGVAVVAAGTATATQPYGENAYGAYGYDGGTSGSAATGTAGQTPASGAGVVEVTAGSAAAAAGLTEGSTIMSLDGVDIGGYGDLSEVLSGHEPGDNVAIAWTDAAGAAHTGTVALGSSAIN